MKLVAGAESVCVCACVTFSSSVRCVPFGKISSGETERRSNAVGSTAHFQRAVWNSLEGMRGWITLLAATATFQWGSTLSSPLSNPRWNDHLCKIIMRPGNQMTCLFVTAARTDMWSEKLKVHLGQKWSENVCVICIAYRYFYMQVMEKYFQKTCGLHRDGMQNRMEATSKCIILSDQNRDESAAVLENMSTPTLRATPLILMVKVHLFLLPTNTRNLPCRRIQLHIGQVTTDLLPVSSYQHFTINLCFSSDYLNWQADNKHQVKARLTADICNNTSIMSSWKHFTF